MSHQALTKLVNLAESNPAVLAELQAAESLEEKAAIGVRHGCDVHVEELAALRAVAKKEAGGELTDAELELVSGAGILSSLKAAAKWVYKNVYVDVKNKVVGAKGTF